MHDIYIEITSILPVAWIGFVVLMCWLATWQEQCQNKFVQKKINEARVEEIVRCMELMIMPEFNLSKKDKLDELHKRIIQLKNTNSQ